MPAFLPRASSENLELALIGDRVPKEFVVPEGIAQRMLGAANPHGKPNADVMRELAPVDPGRTPGGRWLIDFNPAMTEREASLYQEPYAWLAARSPTRGSGWWLNPAASPALRRSLARLERYLAASLDRPQPEWIWLESLLLPTESLLVVARDDDLTHGVLQSTAFQLWWARHRQRLTPVELILAFPFPWAPATPLSLLTKGQEEHRLAISRGSRSASLPQIDSALTAAYGWAPGQTDDEILTQLVLLNQRRAL